MRRVSGSYAEPSPLASVPLSLPISILKNSILKPRKRVTFADPLVTYFDAPVATSSTPTSVSHPPHMSIPKHSMHPSFVDQSSNNISNASLRNSTYSSNNLGLGHAASLNENDSLPLPEMQRTYEQDGNIGGSSSGGGGGSGRSHHKHRHSIHGYSNVIGSDISGSYDPHESKRHRRSQLYWDESSTFLLEKLKLTREHQRDNSHSHSHNNHSCHHRHRSSQRSRSSYNDGSPLSGDASAASATQYRYDERFALAMEHLPINNNQPSS
ncbi:hypothetical protein H4217_005655 [Coemansia sp. RSA 1939]|nr:hypothetical protein H4217_005655 [Coemansia sp. RSA 1939]